MRIAACACISYAALAECRVVARHSLFAHSHPKENVQRRHQAQGRGRAVKELIARYLQKLLDRVASTPP